MAKRSFGINTTTLPTEKVLLDTGVYAGIITNAAVTGKEGKQHINIVKETEWVGPKGKKVRQETGEYTIEGAIYFGAALNSKKAIKTLNQDEPKVFGGQIRLAFHKAGETDGEGNDISFTLKENHVLGAFLLALGLNEINFAETVDFEYNEEIEVPEELQGVPGIIDMMNSLEYQRAFFNNIVQAANGLPAGVKVVKRQPKGGSAENAIDTGNFNDFCGIIKYVEGSENDLG